MKNQPVHQFIRTILKSVKVLFVCLIVLSACKKTSDMAPIPKENSIKKATEWEYREGEIVLGKKLENPYSIENMQKAYDNLIKKYNSASKLNAENQTVKVSHLYIRWLPKSWEEYDELKNDRNLLLYDIPLDYAVEINGNKYHDKTIPEDLPTWQYTVIEKDYKYNKKIKHEILAEAYLPEKDKDLKTKNGRFAAGFSADELINEALTITNNTDYLIPAISKNAKVAWRPGGYVKVYDTRLQQDIPVQGVYVRARRFLSIESGVTNSSGRYDAGGTFGGGADYALYWEAADFDVRSGALGQAWVNGPHLASDWNVTFSSGVDRFYAHVFRGAWRYHYGDIEGLCRPGRVPNYTPPFYSPLITAAIKYAAYDSQGSDQGINYGNWSVFGTNPNIGVWRYTNYGEYESDEIFSTTVHETAHSTHIRVANLANFGNASLAMRESWAVGVEWLITTKEYRNRGINNYGNYNYPNFTNRLETSFNSKVMATYPLSYGYQYWPYNSNINYTSVYIDLVDSNNQFEQSFLLNSWLFAVPVTGSVNDNVSNYNLKTVESTFLKNVIGLNTLRSELKLNKPAGVTDSQIDLLINSF